MLWSYKVPSCPLGVQSTLKSTQGIGSPTRFDVPSFKCAPELSPLLSSLYIYAFA
jgi:hypothetical protein